MKRNVHQIVIGTVAKKYNCILINLYNKYGDIVTTEEVHKKNLRDVIIHGTSIYLKIKDHIYQETDYLYIP